MRRKIRKNVSSSSPLPLAVPGRKGEGRWVRAAVCGMLLLAVLAVFAQTVRHDFINLDDDAYAFDNRHVLQGLSAEGFVWAFNQAQVSAQWQPLTLLSLMADAELVKSGNDPPQRARLAAEMHLVNLALHALNAVILFLLLRAMTSLPSPSAVLSGGRGAGGEGSPSAVLSGGRGTMLRTVPGGEGLWPSALVAAVFAVHPLHVESVAWITERKDVLSGLFGLLTLAAYVWYVRRPSLPRYLLVAAALALGLMAKPMLVTWPLVLLLLDYWPLGRWQGAGSREQGRKGEREKGRKEEEAHLPRSLSPFPPAPFLSSSLRKSPSCSWPPRVPRSPSWPSGPAARSSRSSPRRYCSGLAARRCCMSSTSARPSGRRIWRQPIPERPGGLRAGVGRSGLVGTRDRRGRVGRLARPALVGRGLVLVLGYAAAHHRPGPGRLAGHGRPFPVPAADRVVHCSSVGRRKPGRKGEREKGRKGERERGRKGEREKGRKGAGGILPFSLDPLRGCPAFLPFSPLRSSARRAHRLRLATDHVLAEQRDLVESDLGLHRPEFDRPILPRLGPERPRAGG